jgi:outer membrane murein-binding lipoprotein Lpp
MRYVRVVIFAAILSAFGLTGCKGDQKKCEEAARNYAQLVYWKKANAELDALPESERSLARQKKLSSFTNELENSIGFITEQCVSANNEEQVDCMIKAKTAEEVTKCADPAGSD